MLRQDVLLSGTFYKLKHKPRAVGTSWNKRFFVVEERAGAAGRELALSYYKNE